MPLRFHQLCTGKAELHSRESVYRIVYAPVVRAEAAEQCAVCGVYDGVTFQRCDIALPQVNIGANRREGSKISHTLLKCFLAQIFVLHPQKLLVALHRWTNIEKCAEQALLRLLFRRRCDPFAALIRKSSDEILPSFALRHIRQRRNRRSYQGNSAPNTADSVQIPLP